MASSEDPNGIADDIDLDLASSGAEDGAGGEPEAPAAPSPWDDESAAVMPENLKTLFTPLPDAKEVLGEVEEEEAAQAAESSVIDAEQARFEEEIGAPELPDAVRGSMGAGWVSAEGTAFSPAGEEVEWSAQGRLVVAALDEALSTPQCTEIHAYGADRFSAKVNGENALLHGLRFEDNAEYMRFIEMLATESGGELAWRELRNAGQGTLQMRDGSRLMIILPPATPFAQIVIRKHTAKNWDPRQFVANGTMTPTMLSFLQACVAAKVNLLIVGKAGTGKTTLLRALTHSMGDNERIAVAEQVPELMLSKPLTVSVTYREDIEGQTLVDRLEVLLYGAIDRLLVGEVHFRGLTRMLETMMVAEGSISTYHARSAEEAGERMRVALQMENSLSPESAAALLREAIDVIIVLDSAHGQHRVVQIMEVDWRHTSGGVRLSGNDLFSFDRIHGGFKPTNPPDRRGRVARKAAEQRILIAPEWFHDLEAMQALTEGDGRQRRR